MLVRDAWTARGDDPDSAEAAANIDYNTTDCRRRAAALLAHAEHSYGFSIAGKSVCDIGAGFGGMSLHFALEHGAGRVLAVDQSPHHAAALQTVIREFGLDGVTVIAADLQAFPGHDGSMDLVILNDVLYGADLSPYRVAAVCARLLRHGGIVLFRHVNRAYGPEVASHRDGTQFLDPNSADRAARFISRGAGPTLAHRPLSPWGLAAFLREAGFDELRLDVDSESRDGPQASRGLRPRYLLAGRKIGAGGQSFQRIAPPPDNLLDTRRYHEAVTRGGAGLRTAADELCRLFGGALSTETATAELRGYLADRLVIDGLELFRADPGDAAARGFADAIEHALDHALVAVLSRHAGWIAADFASAEPDRLKAVLDGCVADLRRGFRLPDALRRAALADGGWDALADLGCPGGPGLGRRRPRQSRQPPPPHPRRPPAARNCRRPSSPRRGRVAGPLRRSADRVGCPRIRGGGGRLSLWRAARRCRTGSERAASSLSAGLGGTGGGGRGRTRAPRRRRSRRADKIGPILVRHRPSTRSEARRFWSGHGICRRGAGSRRDPVVGGWRTDLHPLAQEPAQHHAGAAHGKSAQRSRLPGDGSLLRRTRR